MLLRRPHGVQSDLCFYGTFGLENKTTQSLVTLLSLISSFWRFQCSLWLLQPTKESVTPIFIDSEKRWVN